MFNFPEDLHCFPRLKGTRAFIRVNSLSERLLVKALLQPSGWNFCLQFAANILLTAHLFPCSLYVFWKVQLLCCVGFFFLTQQDSVPISLHPLLVVSRFYLHWLVLKSSPFLSWLERFAVQETLKSYWKVHCIMEWYIVLQRYFFGEITQRALSVWWFFVQVGSPMSVSDLITTCSSWEKLCGYIELRYSAQLADRSRGRSLDPNFPYHSAVLVTFENSCWRNGYWVRVTGWFYSLDEKLQNCFLDRG